VFLSNEITEWKRPGQEEEGQRSGQAHAGARPEPRARVSALCCGRPGRHPRLRAAVASRKLPRELPQPIATGDEMAVMGTGETKSVSATCAESRCEVLLSEQAKSP
jgi:hypothetical protein